MVWLRALASTIVGNEKDITGNYHHQRQVVQNDISSLYMYSVSNHEILVFLK